MDGIFDRMETTIANYHFHELSKPSLVGSPTRTDDRLNSYWFKPCSDKTVALAWIKALVQGEVRIKSEA